MNHIQSAASVARSLVSRRGLRATFPHLTPAGHRWRGSFHVRGGMNSEGPHRTVPITGCRSGGAHPASA